MEFGGLQDLALAIDSEKFFIFAPDENFSHNPDEVGLGDDLSFVIVPGGTQVLAEVAPLAVPDAEVRIEEVVGFFPADGLKVLNSFLVRLFARNNRAKAAIGTRFAEDELPRRKKNCVGGSHHFGSEHNLLVVAVGVFSHNRWDLAPE